MSKRPPEDHPILSEILRQLGDVLSPDEAEDVANVVFSETLHGAFADWEGNGLPEMSVVDGGIQANDADVSGEKATVRAKLQVVDDEPLLKEDPYPNVHVKVLSPSDLLSGAHHLFGPTATKSDAVRRQKYPKRGQIQLRMDETQQIAVRLSTQSYRVTCEVGLCHLTVDDVQYVLGSGQSIDVDGLQFSVTGIQETTGWFQSLQ